MPKQAAPHCGGQPASAKILGQQQQEHQIGNMGREGFGDKVWQRLVAETRKCASAKAGLGASYEKHTIQASTLLLRFLLVGGASNASN
jgi:hypothetical protein